MIRDDGSSRDLAALVVPLIGGIAEIGDRYEPYRLVDGDGAAVEGATAFFRDLLAAGHAESTVRSYGMDLLRWFRFVWAAEVPWDRATRAEARDFSRWLQVEGKQPRPHWRDRAPAAGAAGAGEPYALSVRAHSETVLRAFYDFHLQGGTGPVINPFPLHRSRRGGRPNAHHNPMESYHNERSGLYRPRVPDRIPRSVPDEEFNEIFAALPSHRDRALVAFYVSTGARASELLSATVAGLDPGRQLITVVRKGTRELQQLPGLCRRVRLATALSGGDGGADPEGTPAAAVVDTPPPDPSADLSRGAPHVRTGEPAGRHDRDVALAAPYRGLPDG